MKFYLCEYTTYHNGTRINSNYGRYLLDTEPANEEIHLTWDNLRPMYQKLGLNCCFNIWNFKKGRLVSFFSNKFFPTGDFADVKEWKHSDLGITITAVYEEITPSIEQILQWSDGDKAIAYLRERGLGIPEKGA